MRLTLKLIGKSNRSGTTPTRPGSFLLVSNSIRNNRKRQLHRQSADDCPDRDKYAEAHVFQVISRTVLVNKPPMFGMVVANGAPKYAVNFALSMTTSLAFRRSIYNAETIEEYVKVRVYFEIPESFVKRFKDVPNKLKSDLL